MVPPHAAFAHDRRPGLRAWFTPLLLAVAALFATPVYAGSQRAIGSESVVLPGASGHGAAVAEYGPFRVLSDSTVAMAGTVNSATPAQFARLRLDFPRVATILMIDCGGSVDEAANLRLARMIRQAGVTTHVPAHGSVRSGAVELFLAGREHTADPGAEFLVHSWIDEAGRQAGDYPANDPVHREYLDYYAEMGVPADKARAFYDLTNSVPFESALRLSKADLSRYAILD